MKNTLWLMLVLALLPVNAAFAGDGKFIRIHVEPYYRAADSPDESPKVRVFQHIDALLASTDAREVLKARDVIQQQPAMISPMTMMVLAIRLYDVGLRDDGVFWFYAAKDRYMTMDGVIHTGAPQIAGASIAIRDFATLAGPYFNSYAFCDIGKQQKIRVNALDWVKAHPYEAIFLPQMPARDGDRRENLDKALLQLEAAVREEQQILSDPERLADFRAQREANNVDEEFCR